MKWQVEDLSVHCNILEDKEGVHKDDQEPIGMGYPAHVAKRIVEKHNESIEMLQQVTQERDVAQGKLAIAVQALEAIQSDSLMDDVCSYARVANCEDYSTSALKEINQDWECVPVWRYKSEETEWTTCSTKTVELKPDSMICPGFVIFPKTKDKGDA